MRCLTDEERKFATINHNLILKFMHKKNLSIWESDHYYGTDWYGVCSIGFCKAVISFDKSYGNSFATYAYTCMENAVKIEYRRIYNETHGKGICEESFDKINENDEDYSLLDTILGADSLSLEDDVISRAMIDQAMEKLNEEEYFIINRLVCGYKQKEVALLIGKSQAAVSRTKRKFLNMICDKKEKAR